MGSAEPVERAITHFGSLVDQLMDVFPQINRMG